MEIELKDLPFISKRRHEALMAGDQEKAMDRAAVIQRLLDAYCLDAWKRVDLALQLADDDKLFAAHDVLNLSLTEPNLEPFSYRAAHKAFYELTPKLAASYASSTDFSDPDPEKGPDVYFHFCACQSISGKAPLLSKSMEEERAASLSSVLDTVAEASGPAILSFIPSLSPVFADGLIDVLVEAWDRKAPDLLDVQKNDQPVLAAPDLVSSYVTLCEYADQGYSVSEPIQKRVDQAWDGLVNYLLDQDYKVGASLVGQLVEQAPLGSTLYFKASEHLKKIAFKAPAGIAIHCPSNPFVGSNQNNAPVGPKA